MRLSSFLPLYAGILLIVAFVAPVWRAVPGSPVAVASPEEFPRCWQFTRDDYFGNPYSIGPIVLERTQLKFPFDTTWYQAREGLSTLVAWAPAQGDSFDIAFYHDPVIRFPRAAGPVIGRVYFQAYPNLIMALLDQASYATGEAVDCPRNGGPQ